MLMRHMTAAVFVLAVSAAGAGAQEFQIVKVASVAGSAVDNLKSKTIFFNDHRVDETSDKGAFIHFDARLALIDDVIKPGYAAVTGPSAR